MTGTALTARRPGESGVAPRPRAALNAIVVACVTLGVGTVAVLLFRRCLDYFFVTDDFALIEAGRAPLRVGIPAHFLPKAGSLYRPLAEYGYFWLLDPHLGLDPRAWHVANLVLHLAVVAVAAVVFRQLLTSWSATAAAAAAFGLHSALFLVLAWVAVVGDLVPTLFSLLALALYLRYLDRRGARGARGAAALIAAVLACLAALLSKESAASLPPILVLAQLLLAPSERRVAGRRVWLGGSALPFLGLLAGYLLLVTRVEGTPASGPYHPELGAGTVWTFLTYAWWAIDLPQQHDFIAHTALAVLGLAGVALVVGAAVRRDRVILFGLGWFALGIAPVLPFPGHMFHYYLYWALGGLALVLGRLVDGLGRLRPPAARWALAAVLLLAIVAGDRRGIDYQLATDQTMAQATQGQRVLAVLHHDHPTLPNGSTIYFADPAAHVYYLTGYGAGVRLSYPGIDVRVYYAGQIPLPPNPSRPVYSYRWNGETVVPVPSP
ncbi:MAG TPA: hypothetical protein VMU89_11790 [Thermomicrobiaceae bacterium]|nr:hypothetical protein [Thermomicrobiaceae bacterium]